METLISGLSHITLIVKDLEHSSLFFEKVFEAREIYASGNTFFSWAREKFFLINSLWICIMEGESLIERTYNHIAFQVQEGDMDEYVKRLADIGVEIEQGRPRASGEGRSLYFYDFDNHLFELHTGTLRERLACYSQE